MFIFISYLYKYIYTLGPVAKFVACKLAYKQQSFETSSDPILYIKNNKILLFNVY